MADTGVSKPESRKVVSLENIEAARVSRMHQSRPVGSESERYRLEQVVKSLMAAEAGTSKRATRVGKRPVGRRGIPRLPSETLNAGIIANCPGSSQHPGLNFVKAVYADRTGQE